MNGGPVPDEVRIFRSPKDYENFCAYIDELVASKVLIEMPADPNYSLGEVFGGRWFMEPSTNSVWRLVSPDFPFKGLWERVHMSSSKGPAL